MRLQYPVIACLLLASVPVEAGDVHHYVNFNRDRDRIHEQSFLDTERFVGAQLKYAWKELEPEKDVYDLDVIEQDLAFLEKHGKKLFIQLQEVSFDTMYVNVPRYLRTSPEYNGGVALQYEYAGEDESEWPQEGFVARRWDGAVQERLHKLFRVLGERFDGRIEGITLAETAVEFGRSGELYPEGFAPARYRDAVIENMRALKGAFGKSVVMVYANFMPGEALPENDRGYLASVCDSAWAMGVGIGGPDLLPTRTGQQNHSLRFIRESRGKVPTGVAVQWGNYEQVDRETGKRVTVAELMEYARENLGVQYIFWSTQEPYYSEELVPLLSSGDSKPAAGVPDPARIPPADEWATYTIPSGEFQFRYPSSVLTLKEEGTRVFLYHSVPYEYRYFPHGSEDEVHSYHFMDFSLHLWFEARELESVITENYARPRYWIKGNEFEVDPGFIDPVEFGDLKGHRVSIGAHCGGWRTHYLPFAGGHVIARRPFCWYWEDCSFDCIEELNNTPGIITEEMSERLFEKIMKTIKQ